MPPQLPTLDLLLPVARAGERLDPEPGEPALHELYAHPAARPGHRTAVRANMIATLDGSAQGPDSHSRSINGPADWRVFRVQRAVADVVLVGAGTARDEGYGPLRVPADLRTARAERGQDERLALALVTRSGDLPDSLHDVPCEDRPYIITVADNPRLDQIDDDRLIIAGQSTVDLAVALDALADRGLTRVLAEGGPRLLGDLIDADLVDELCLTISPVLTGGPGIRPVRTRQWLSPTVAAHPVHVVHGAGMLLGRWSLRPAS